MKILVTGGSGFIGSAFVRLAIKKGYNIVNVDALTYAGSNSNLDMVKLNKVLKTTEFKQMQSLEKVQDFTEAMIDKKTNTRKSFFRLGPNNDWKKDLKKNNIEKIEQAFEKEMIELGYI